MSVIFACTAIVVHLVFLYAVFDVYFTSPLVHGTEPYAADLADNAPARRLVLFVADGLRADKCFELDDTGQPRTPFLRKIIQDRGAWGVSHTRVPTESRPGHVAIIAGFYEDVSAVAKGWKDNPVLFDSVFNKSRHTWSWGSPDILPMFSKGIVDGHVSINTYGAEVEDFAGKDLYRLDTWVFTEFENFVTSAVHNATLMEALQQDRVVFFLHLLGIDTNGHAYKPQSKEYLDNIKIMDEGIKNVTLLLEDFYGDDKTAFIMTSDHGMTNWGSHGTGHPEETLTPFVGWGAGLRGPVAAFHRQHALHHDEKCVADGLCDAGRVADVSKWNLSDIQRQDLDQADMAPLMAALLGLAFPANSVGLLRTSLLSMSDHDKAQSMLANARQVAAQFKVKEEQVEKQTLQLLFRPHRVTASDTAARLREASAAVARQEYVQTERLAIDVITDALAGLAYYHAYDRTFLGVCLVLGFSGWMAYTMVAMLPPLDVPISAQYTSRWSPMTVVFAVGRATIVALLLVQSSPVSYYVYSLSPTWLWEEVFKRGPAVNRCLRLGMTTERSWSGLVTLLSLCCGLELMVLSFFHRELLSLGLLCLAIIPWCSTAKSGHRPSAKPRQLLICWSTSCVVLAVFPLLPVVGRSTHYNLVLLAACCASIVTYYEARVASETLLKYQSALLLVTGLVVKWTSLSVEAKQGLPVLCQMFSWVLLGSTFFIPLASSLKPRARLSSLAAAFVTLYLTFSISHESLFFVVLSFFLFIWYYTEDHWYSKEAAHCIPAANSWYSTTQRDAQLAFVFVYIITVGFFGTGNIASLNSFEPASVYCYLTIFNPFLMGGLMLLKVILPFLLISCAFSIILHGRHHTAQRTLSSERVFLIILLMSDFMGLHFFFLIKNEGSWLDIGTSISHYVIALATTIVLLLFYEIAHIMTTTSLQWIARKLKVANTFKVYGVD